MYVDIMILVHLSRQPYHGYELKRQIEESTASIAPINNNHLYPALRRFEEMGAITREVERQTGKPDRHVYHITDRGKELLQVLLQDFTPELAHNEREFFIRVAFFHLLDVHARLPILRTRLAHLQQTEEHLGRFHRQVVESVEIEDYALRILSFKRQQNQEEMAWIAELLKELEHESEY